MSRRFVREGSYVKNHLPHHKTGIRSFARDLLWDGVGWHYRHYMGHVALKSLRSSQKEVQLLQEFHSYIIAGEKSTAAQTSPTKDFFFATFIPNNVPILASTNPFCPISQNQTGWQEVFVPRRPHPRPLPRHQVGGSDPRPLISLSVKGPGK